VEGGELQGSLIVASDHIKKVTNKYYSHIIFFRWTMAKSWNLGGRTPDGQRSMNVRVVETSQTTGFILNIA